MLRETANPHTRFMCPALPERWGTEAGGHLVSGFRGDQALGAVRLECTVGKRCIVLPRPRQSHDDHHRELGG